MEPFSSAENNSYPITTTNIAGITHILASSGVPQHVTASLTGGQLGGILNARDQQIPAFENQLDQLAYAIGTAVNQQNQLGIDASGNPGQQIFNLPAIATGSAASISVALTNPQLIAAAGTGEGTSGNSNALALGNLANLPLLSGETLSDSLAAFLGTVGTTAANASANSTTQQATLAQLTTQRNSLSGVSLDEEAANLTPYQRAYEAASKVFSIVDTLLANAITLGEQTTVS